MMGVKSLFSAFLTLLRLVFVNGLIIDDRHSTVCTKWKNDQGRRVLVVVVVVALVEVELGI